MFCGKLRIQTVSDENCERYGRHSGSKSTLHLIARGWLPEGNLKNCLLRFPLCLLFMGQKTWRDMEDCGNLSLAFHLAPGCGKSGSMFGDIFFLRKCICKMNRNSAGTEINPRFGVFHIQKDEARHFRNEISEAVSNGPNGPNGPKDYAGCWGIPSGAGLVGQRLEVPRSIAGQGHWSRVDLASFVERLVQLM